MKKIDNFANSLDVLQHADFHMAENDAIYRTGVIGQFNLTFELAWKAMRQELLDEGVQEAETGSPRDILKLASSFGIIKDSSLWLLMLKKRNESTHIYNEEEVDEMLLQIRDSFIGAFAQVLAELKKRSQE